MSALAVSGLCVDLGGREVLRDVALEVDAGTFAAVIGPSGCGKSTLLRAIAGLVRPREGSIRVDGVEINDGAAFVPAARRRVGWVPQSPSLFPHLSVEQNVAFGAGGRGGRRGSDESRLRLAELMRMTGLEGLERRYPDQLSGGQAQRVGLARSLAARPDLLLLDEPFAALDPTLRDALRDDVRSLLSRLGVTGVLVTHDQSEALATQSVIVMRDGAVVQQGAPSDVYRRPVSAWVAQFLGQANLLPAGVRHDAADTAFGTIAVNPHTSHASTVMIRPEQLRLGREGVRMTVARVRYGGHDALVDLTTDDGQIVVARVGAHDIPPVGIVVGVSVHGQGVALP